MLGEGPFNLHRGPEKGYWQRALKPTVRPKSAFSTSSGHWQYQVLPFGLHGVPANFQQLMDVICSATLIDHLFHQTEVLKGLQQAGLTANACKCHMGLTEAQYLRFCIWRGLVIPQGCNIMPLPVSVSVNAQMYLYLYWEPNVDFFV